MNKKEAIEYLIQEGYTNLSLMESLKDNDIVIMFSKVNPFDPNDKAVRVEYQSENYNLMNELFDESQEEGAYAGNFIIQ